MDQRAHLRFDLNLEIRYRILESLKSHKGTSTENMSEKGIKIILPEYIKPATVLELIIRVPHESRPICALGRIAWIRKELFEDYFYAGIHLVYIKQRDKQRFYKYAIF